MNILLFLCNTFLSIKFQNIENVQLTPFKRIGRKSVLGVKTGVYKP